MEDTGAKRDLSPAQALAKAIEHSQHLLPAQSPLDRFVHHNPLHHWEELPFEEGVMEAARVYGNEPFWSQDAYRQAFATSRVWESDLDATLKARVPDEPLPGGLDRRSFTKNLLRYPIPDHRGEQLSWVLGESDVLNTLRSDLSESARDQLLAEAGGDEVRLLQELWAAVQELKVSLPQDLPAPVAPVRLRDELVQRGGADPDSLVHPLLIRWSGGYLDHGLAYWNMPGREVGFLKASLSLLTQPLDLGRPWLRALRSIASVALKEDWDAARLSIAVLERMGHPVERWTQVVEHTLLALPGWAGMFQRLFDRPDTAPARLGIPFQVQDFLALRLLLDLSAAEFLAAGSGAVMQRVQATGPLPQADPGPDPNWLLFQLCQIQGIGPHKLRLMGSDGAATLCRVSVTLSDWERRVLWHDAYERRFKTQWLDAIQAHAFSRSQLSAPTPRVQISMCIDDREESLRRLIEETAPWIETLGVAGNYGISMYYRGLEHGHPVALGPAGFEPKHVVKEVLVDPQHAQSKRLAGLFQHSLSSGSQTLFRGAMISLAGVASALPMALRILAPKAHARLGRQAPKPPTKLICERYEQETDDHGYLLGFSLDEMVQIVRGTLEFMSLLQDFAPLVISLGHGSRSMNNPHEAAHDCGACGGGRGGPNARLFAQFANDPRVRERLATGGIHIPDGTWFLGGYHNTADDEVELFDLHLVPSSHKALLQDAVQAIDRARTMDALERCRKFESAALDLSPEQALDHVENRDEDLAQPRPEYGHCTNAICLVGDRAWSRGLFMDRRAFLCSYKPERDPDGDILARLLAMAVPVGAGINLEYWFSVVDPSGYGSGTKLPHNITGLVGVMDGHQSDLRTGLPWQMVEVHEPVRLLCVVEASTERLLKIATENPAIGRLVVNNWVHLASLDPETGEMQVFEDGAFRPYSPPGDALPLKSSSRDWFQGSRGLLPAASIRLDMEEAS